MSVNSQVVREHTCGDQTRTGSSNLGLPELVLAANSRAPIPPRFRGHDNFVVFRCNGNLPMARFRDGPRPTLIWISRGSESSTATGGLGRCSRQAVQDLRLRVPMPSMRAGMPCSWQIEIRPCPSMRCNGLPLAKSSLPGP